MKTFAKATALLAIASVCWGCAATHPRIFLVTGPRMAQAVGEADARVFSSSRAAGFVSPRREPTAAEEPQEITVCWSGSMVDKVKLEYRRAGVANQMGEQTLEAVHRNSHVFHLAAAPQGDAGPVTAWRVTLWQGNSLVAEQHSALWQ